MIAVKRRNLPSMAFSSQSMTLRLCVLFAASEFGSPDDREPFLVRMRGPRLHPAGDLLADFASFEPQAKLRRGLPQNTFWGDMPQNLTQDVYRDPLALTRH